MPTCKTSETQKRSIGIAKTDSRCDSARAYFREPRIARLDASGHFARNGEQQKGSPERQPRFTTFKFDFLPYDRRVRTRQRHRFAGFNDVGGLGVIRIGARGDTKTSHRDAGHERNNHDLQMRTAIR
jgi:hypothetical protein